MQLNQTKNAGNLSLTHLVVVLHDLSLDLGSVDPGDEIFHVAGHQVGRVAHCLWSNTDVYGRSNKNEQRQHMSFLSMISISLSRKIRYVRPCSTKVTASLTVSAILSLHITMGNRRRQNELTVTLSVCENCFWAVMMPMLYNFSSRASSCLARKGSWGGRSEILLASALMFPQSLLYLNKKKDGVFV